jgi:hypothetical protein
MIILVVSNMDVLFSIIFHVIWDVILPIDELMFFRGVGIPPTSHSYCGWWKKSHAPVEDGGNPSHDLF